MEQIGAATEIETQVNRVWAECYPLVNNARSLQDVYLDAQLARKVEKQYATAQWGDRSVRLAQHTFSLPKEETDRLRAMAHARDASLVRAELEGLFLGPMPTPEEMPAFQEAARAWIGNGVIALRKGGSEGLSAYVATVGRWIAKYRRRGGDNRTRLFVNLFAYESKVAFYTLLRQCLDRFDSLATRAPRSRRPQRTALAALAPSEPARRRRYGRPGRQPRRLRRPGVIAPPTLSLRDERPGPPPGAGRLDRPPRS